MKKTLNGKWSFKATDSTEWKDASVPGCNYLDLMSNNDIPDPFVGLNEKDVSWVGQKDWEYKRTFELSDNELGANDILLNAKMLDTICDVYINDKLLFSGQNCFIAYSKSVKDFVSAGENEIRILFHSPVNYVKEKYKACPTPVNSNGQNGIVHIRKPQCHFGWDWGPVLPFSGITKDIELEFVEGARLDFLEVSQSLDNDNATISAKVDVTSYKDYECEITLTFPNGDTQTVKGCECEFNIESPELWWTYDISKKKKQPLYKIEATLTVDGKSVDSSEKYIGIRTIELNRERDEWGKNFQFKLNGVPLFIKGANYIPPDSLITRFTDKELNYLLDATMFSNMNMLRIWGGGYYESDEFYHACDERGILLWQDFQFACQAYPFFNDDFLENVLDEVKYNVNRLKHHASLAVWNGNNEIEDMHMAWVTMTKYVDWTEKFFYTILEPEIRKYDTVTPYTPGSPIGISHNKGVYSDNVGDTHLWGVWHGLQPMTYYRKRMTRFCSEFGFESLPDIKAIEQFAKPEDYSLDSDVFNAHQKCMNGNDKIVYYIASRFHLPKHFKDYIYLSQVAQLKCIEDATEHWRRNKGRCNGSMYWQFNDCWGVCSWASIDYYGNYKALQYGAKHFNAPLSVSIEDSEKNARIIAINDFNEPKVVEVEYEIFDFENGTIKTEKTTVGIEAVKNAEVFNIDLATLNKKKNGIAVRLYENGEQVMQKTLLLDAEKDIDLPRAKLKTKITVYDDKLDITVKADKFARLIQLECSKSTMPFSDNYFDLLPNQEKTVTFTADGDMKALAESISVRSLTDIDFDKNRVKAKLKQFKLYLSPVNIGNAVHHGKVAKDVDLDD